MTFAPISAACGSSLAAIAIKSGTNLVHRLAPSCRTTSAINVAALDLTAYASPPPPSLTSRSIPCANAAISILSLSLIVRHRPRTNSRSVAYPKCLASSALSRAHSDRHVSIAIRQSPRFNCAHEKVRIIHRARQSIAFPRRRASRFSSRHRVSSRFRARPEPFGRSFGRSGRSRVPYLFRERHRARARLRAPQSSRTRSEHFRTPLRRVRRHDARARVRVCGARVDGCDWARPHKNIHFPRGADVDVGIAPARARSRSRQDATPRARSREDAVSSRDGVEGSVGTK